MMTIEQISDHVLKHNREIAALQEKISSAHKRIDENDRMTEGVHKLAANVETLAAQIKMLTDSVNTRIGKLEEGQKSQGERIGALEKEPAHKWKALMTQVGTLIVAALVGGALSNFLN